MTTYKNISSDWIKSLTGSHSNNVTISVLFLGLDGQTSVTMNYKLFALQFGWKKRFKNCGKAKLVGLKHNMMQSILEKWKRINRMRTILLHVVEQLVFPLTSVFFCPIKILNIFLVAKEMERNGNRICMLIHVLTDLFKTSCS